jgi:hypothetical protein
MSVITLPLHNASQWIVLAGPFRFISQKLFDLVMVRGKKAAVQIDKPPGLPGAQLCASGTNRKLRGPPMFVPFIAGT